MSQPSHHRDRQTPTTSPFVSVEDSSQKESDRIDWSQDNLAAIIRRVRTRSREKPENMPNTLKDVLVWSNTVQVLEAEKVVTKWVAFSTPSEMLLATFQGSYGNRRWQHGFPAFLAAGQLGPFRLTVKILSISFRWARRKRGVERLPCSMVVKRAVRP